MGFGTFDLLLLFWFRTKIKGIKFRAGAFMRG
jgi:hypothetical protein